MLSPLIATFSINQNHQESVSAKVEISNEISFSINQNHQESVSITDEQMRLL